MKSIGQTFHQLRKEQGTTLSEAAKGICSTSNLSRWENNKISLNFHVVVQLLNRIHIDTDEFLNYNDFKLNDQLPEDVIQVNNSKDISKINSVMHEYLERYDHSKNIYQLYIASILANQYQIITGRGILPLKAQIHLYNYFSKTTLWSFFNLSFFGNSIFLIEPSRVYAISMQIINNFDFTENDWNLVGLITTLGTLCDATISLILRNSLKPAIKVLQALNKVKIPKYLDFFNLVFKFLEKIIHYVKDKNEQPVLSFINSCVTLGMETSASIFIDVFKQVKNAES